MSVLKELDEITKFGSNLHCFFVGNCTMYASPGKFASVRDQSGKTQFVAEGPTSEIAMQRLVEKIRNNDRSSHVPKAVRSAGDDKRVKLPGMP